MSPVFYAHADAEEICTRAGEDGSSLLDCSQAFKISTLSNIPRVFIRNHLEIIMKRREFYVTNQSFNHTTQKRLPHFAGGFEPQYQSG